MLNRVQRNVKAMDKSGRESVTPFERGVGDVLVTYENKLIPRIEQGRLYDFIIPTETVRIENPVAVVHRHTDRYRLREIADAFVAFLHEKESQCAFAEFGFRPTNETWRSP